MQHFFIAASDAKKGFTSTHPYSSTVFLSKSADGWPMNGNMCKTPDLWLNETNRKMLLLGITQVQCVCLEPAPEEAARFTFYFAKESERYRFDASILQNTKGFYKRSVYAKNENQSLQQQRNVEVFRATSEVDLYIHRENPTSFTITTYWRHDDLIVAMQIAEKSFDAHHTHERSVDKTPLLLRRYEKA